MAQSQNGTCLTRSWRSVKQQVRQLAQMNRLWQWNTLPCSMEVLNVEITSSWWDTSLIFLGRLDFITLFLKRWSDILFFNPRQSFIYFWNICIDFHCGDLDCVIVDECRTVYSETSYLVSRYLWIKWLINQFQKRRNQLRLNLIFLSKMKNLFFYLYDSFILMNSTSFIFCWCYQTWYIIFTF